MKIFENFLKPFQKIEVFVQTREKQTPDLLIPLKTCLNNAFEAIFLRTPLKIFEKILNNFPQFGFSSKCAKKYR